MLVSPVLAHTGVGPTNSFVSGIAHPLYGGGSHPRHDCCRSAGCACRRPRDLGLADVLHRNDAGRICSSDVGLANTIRRASILSSIIILGLFVALAVKAPIWMGTAITSLFAFFHGHAHGTEASAASLISYVAGFAIATAGLHAAGIGLGLFSQGWIGKVAVRVAGAVAILGGIALLSGC